MLGTHASSFKLKTRVSEQMGSSQPKYVENVVQSPFRPEGKDKFWLWLLLPKGTDICIHIRELQNSMI